MLIHLKLSRTELLNLLQIAAGILLAGLGLNGFLLSSNFIDGGVTGVSMLLAKTTGLSLAVLLPIVNLPFVLVAYRLMGKAFALRSILGIGGLALVLKFIPYPDVTSDLVLTSIFGGCFIGAGIGLAVRGGAVLDGTEIVALLLSKRFVGFKVGDIILSFNVLLFAVALFVLGVNEVLYSILTYFAAAKTLDFVLYGIDEFTSITIISPHNRIISARITGEMGRGVTLYSGRGALSGSELEIVQVVITRLELGRIRSIVREIDPSAFVFFYPIAGAEGGVVKKKSFNHGMQQA